MDLEFKFKQKLQLIPSFEDGHCANIIFNGNIIGIIGEIDSKIIDNYKIRVPVVGFEISLSDSIFKFI